ncbi:hypothetical protein [Paraflavitalea pollutisoli]|uniref:hypothetical protein n=1 Tax=Paraflavitalea pollutisoli TaxID=3034143 RepID=UPI0023ECA9EB|nr:hypothetical protein [Paraflavitalea sp. H1-2-19X]
MEKFLYRCFCTCACMVLLWSDYSINLIGLYPLVAGTAARLQRTFSVVGLRRTAMVGCQLLALSFIP